MSSRGPHFAIKMHPSSCELRCILHPYELFTLVFDNFSMINCFLQQVGACTPVKCICISKNNAWCMNMGFKKKEAIKTPDTITIYHIFV